MYVIINVPYERRGRADDVLKDDVVSRQSIVIRDSSVLGMPGFGVLVLIEGGEDAVKRALKLFEGIGERLPDEKERESYQKIKAEEDSAATGMGMIFGD